MKRALISVYAKEGIDRVAGLLQRSGWEIISTGGSAHFLRDHGVRVIEVSDVTRFAEILDGRVKTLHPLIFAAILARESAEHEAQLSELSLPRIDLVMVNFYPFAEALQKKRSDLDYMLENVDVGGPALVRAAAKNFPCTIVVVDENDYLPVAEALAQDGNIPLTWRRELAQKAFAYTASYDALIAEYLWNNKTGMPLLQSITGRNMLTLRYGENPHQQAALYIGDRNSPLYALNLLQGKELSYNNILDLSMVYEVLNDFAADQPFCVIVKHQNPCGAALAETQAQAFARALAGDSKSAFGGIVGLNGAVSEDTARALAEIFLEVIVAPDFTPAALAVLKKRKNLRLLRLPLGYRNKWDFRPVGGGFVMQTRDELAESAANFTTKTSHPISNQERQDAGFAWRLVKYVRSNGILLARQGMVVGVGAGQMSRIDSVALAISKAQPAVAGAVLASDAYFPFPDSVEIAARNGIRVLVEPGGSVKDGEVIAAAEKLGMALLFTGIRHFRH